MKFKKPFIFIFLIILLFSTTACATKKVITTNKFINIAKKEKLTIYDATDQYKTNKYIKKCLVSINLRGWRVEFYELNNVDNAENMFNLNKKKFEKEKTKNSTEISSNWRNYSTYSLTTSQNYYYLCRVENTLIYVDVDAIHKKQVINFINKIGY